MAFLRDIFDISIPGQRINAAREQRAQRQAAADERARQMEAFKAIQEGDVETAAGFDPNLAGQYQGVQAGQQEMDAVKQGRLQQAGVAAVRGARALAERTGDPLGAIDTIASRSGSLFPPEALAEVRSLVEQHGPAAFDIIEQSFTEPRRTGTPSKPFAVVDEVTGEQVLVTQDPQTGELRRVEGYGPAADNSSALDQARLADIYSRIDDRETRGAAATAKEERAQKAAEAKDQAKADFAFSSNQQAMRQLDTVLGFFGEEGQNLQTEGSGLGRIVGAARRRGSTLVPGTDMARLQQQIEPLKGIIGLDRLVELKSSGATLGQVSNFELQALQSTLGNLEQVDDPSQLYTDLMFIRDTLQKINDNLEADGYSPVGGEGDGQQGDDTVISFEEFMGGN